MITNSNNKTVNKSSFEGNWSFLPTAFSAFMGVAIGLAIGNYLGWI